MTIFLLTLLCGVPGLTLYADTTVTDTITVSFTEAGGIALLGITDVAVSLEAAETGNIILPGAQYTVTVTEGEANGGRLHYTVHGQTGDMKITVRTSTAVEPGTLSVEVLTAPGATGGGDRGTAVSGKVYLNNTSKDLITGIGDCYTGTGDTDGPLVRYTLSGDPGFSIGDVVIEYTLTADP